jgi:hypothetical protein
MHGWVCGRPSALYVATMIYISQHVVLITQPISVRHNSLVSISFLRGFPKLVLLTHNQWTRIFGRRGYQCQSSSVNSSTKILNLFKMELSSSSENHTRSLGIDITTALYFSGRWELMIKFVKLYNSRYLNFKMVFRL